ncbi:hypothetical protein ACTJKN_05250 [Pedobacter sp. 22163]|uniref:hypothetical protein n=1 Tax=Pedobacter sp. 22163 TaxID=3453883 RepID=UPI003F84E6E4
MIELLNINNSNLGGVYILRFAPRFFFSSLNPLDLLFKEGFEWITIRLTSESGQVDHESALDNGDPFYNVSITASLPKERPEIDTVLDKYTGLPCVVNLHDQNSRERLAGHHAGELVLMHSSTSGKVTADENGYQISFKGKQQYKADFITL